MPNVTRAILAGSVALAAAIVPTAAQMPAPPVKLMSIAEAGRLADTLVAQMTLDEKIAMLHGDRDPENVGQAGYLPGVPRLGIPPMRLSDGPAGVRMGHPATALPSPVALAATFSPDLARQYGQAIGMDGRALRQDVMLAPMVNIVRVPQGGRNFETLGEDPLLASRLVAAEIEGIQSEGLMATVKHFAENNQENARQSVSADVDERTMHEIELPGFEAAVKDAHVASVMASYNKVNGTWASENGVLETDILRKMWGFDGFVMSDWGATHSAAPALMAGLEMEMPGGNNYSKLSEAVKSGALSEAVVNQAVRRILVQMARFGLLSPNRTAPTMGSVAPTSPTALEVATDGAVLLKNANNILPLGQADFASLAVIGPTAKTLLVGGGGSARVPAVHGGSVLDELKSAAGANASINYAIGYDLEGEVIPATQLDLTQVLFQGGPTGQSVGGTGSARSAAQMTIEFMGPRALSPGQTATWQGTLTARDAGDYEIRLQTAGGRGTIQIDPPPPGAAPPAGAGPGRGGRGGGRGGGAGAAGLLTTSLGLTNPMLPVHFDGGQTHAIVVTATAGAQTPMEVRLAWVPPGWREKKIAEAAEAARKAHTAVVFAYDEGSEGRDRSSLSLLGYQDALIEAVAAANPRTVVVLNNGAPVTMPWVDKVAAILQMWYPGQEGAKATAAILSGAASPGGKLPVTFPKRAEDAPTADPARYPGVNGHGAYSEGIFVGYRWYDAKHIEPLFPFGHGLSYTTFTYSNLTITRNGDTTDVHVTVRNTGSRAGSDVVQVYLGPPASPPVEMAAKSLAAFERVTLAPGASKTLVLHVAARARSYWDVKTHDWVQAEGKRTVFVGASSRDIRLQTDVTFIAPVR